MSILAFALRNWTWLLPLVALFVVSTDDGIRRLQVANRNVTIAEMKAQDALNIAAAEKAVREFHEADAKKTAGIIADLNTEKSDLERKLNAASIALAEVPPPVEPPGCPDPMARADVAAFLAGLPPDDADGKTGAGGAPGAAGPGRALPAPAR